MKKIICALFAVTVLGSGCAMGPLRFNINVNTITGPNPLEKNKYNILPLVKGVDKDDLQFQEFSSYVDRALQMKGFQKVEANVDPEVTIFLSYGISDPTQRIASAPIYGQTGGGISSFNADTSSNIYSSSGNTYTGNSTTSGTIYQAPTFGVVGSQTYSYSTFDRFLVLDAVDYTEFKATKKMKSLWKTTITSTGSSGDIRRVFPILVAAAVPHIAENTGKQISVTLTEEKEVVKEIKGIAEPVE